MQKLFAILVLITKVSWAILPDLEPAWEAVSTKMQ